MRLLLVRHGETPSNVGHLLDTAVPGPGLTALGEHQAAALPDALAGEDIRAVFASPLARARLTAAPLAAARGLRVLVRDGIREVSAGDLEMLPGDSEGARLYMTTVFAWAKGETGLRIPGGESGEEVLGRVRKVASSARRAGRAASGACSRRAGRAPAYWLYAGVRPVRREGVPGVGRQTGLCGHDLARYDAVVAEAAALGAGTVALVSHGAAIRMWTAARAGNVDVPFAAAHPLRNTGVVALEGSPAAGWTALTWAGEAVTPAGAPGPTGRAVTEEGNAR
ncbi:histidine phosphatase family protein [Streptomyces griseosporeus]|uniref:histidine phosphatase family protein n=1 Tax=Streptomyces griseosporeus TaxID=1910 RepID=UPI0036FC71ED